MSRSGMTTVFMITLERLKMEFNIMIDWRSHHYTFAHVRNKNSNIQVGNSDFPYHKELLLKERIRSLWDTPLIFLRCINCRYV